MWGQQFGRSILDLVAVGVGEARVQALFGTCMEEVEKYCVILEN